MTEHRHTILTAAVVVFALIVLIADLASPLGGMAWVLYIPVILAPVWVNSSRLVIIVSVACSALVIFGLFIPHGDPETWRALRNRGMGLMALWLTASTAMVICRRSLRLTEVMQKLAHEMQQRKELEHEVLEVASREQRRIGQELHDGVGQELTGLGLMANALAQRLSDAGTEKQIANRLLTGMDRVHQHVRALSRGLVPVQVEGEGLCAALEDLAARTSEESGIRVTFHCDQGAGVPVQATATELFRIAQEAVSNALRHGRPQQIELSLVREPAGLCLRIKDDGVGIDGRADEGRGMGLRIMQFRAEQIGGVLQIGPAPGGGTQVRCLLPVTKEANHEGYASSGAGAHSNR